MFSAMFAIGVGFSVFATHLLYYARAQPYLAKPALRAADVGVYNLAAGNLKLRADRGGFKDDTWGYVVCQDNRVARFSLMDVTNVHFLDLPVMDPETSFGSSAFQDGTWGYVSSRYAGLIARFSLLNFTHAEVLNLSATDPDLADLPVDGGFQDGTWGYVFGAGKVARFSLENSTNVDLLNLSATEPKFAKYGYPLAGFRDDTWGYVFENGGGDMIVRFALQNFTRVDVLILPLTNFRGGFQDGTWGYLVSYASDKVARFNLQRFANIDVLDLSVSSWSIGGCFQDGIWGYVLLRDRPNYWSSDYFAYKVVRFSLQNFANVEHLDVTDWVSGGFYSAFQDGEWGYATVPSDGRIVRFSLAWNVLVTTSTMTTTWIPWSWATTDLPSGIQYEDGGDEENDEENLRLWSIGGVISFLVAFLGIAVCRAHPPVVGALTSSRSPPSDAKAAVLPTYWQCQSDGWVRRLEPECVEVKQAMQQLFDKTWKGTATRDRAGRRVSRFEVVSVQRNENTRLWAAYHHCREKIKAKLEASGGTELYSAKTAIEIESDSAAEEARMLIERAELSEMANEFYLFHGTTPKAMRAICKSDFRLDKAGSATGTMYGKGLYFAEASSKSDEYAVEDRKAGSAGVYHMLVCRVTCGAIKYTDEANPPVNQLVKLIRMDGCHSLLGDREKCRGTYREFIVFDNNQVYPEYIVTYRRVYA